MRRFCKVFAAEPWYMKAWSSKEIAALTKLYGVDHATILQRMRYSGPVPRMLFSLGFLDTRETLERRVNEALAGDLFAFTFAASSHPVFIVQPLIVIDQNSGRARLQRSDYRAEFISSYIAQKTIDFAEKHSERVQVQLARALDTSVTRSVAGKVVEGLVYLHPFSAPAPSRAPSSSSAKWGTSSLKAARPILPKSARCTSARNPQASPPSMPSSLRTLS
ncbi:hypothetical protein B0H12DRAFT_236750 [Mycena haematopus]|nr:hypothetical protein B0H12DRAFT_236750 [Mycena haematopus]